jgi:hypothetical protein
VHVLDAIVYPDLPEWLVVGVAVVEERSMRGFDACARASSWISATVSGHGQGSSSMTIA